jgi:hypothetical protein
MRKPRLKNFLTRLGHRFAGPFPVLRGNNWLLTWDFAFIDLLFFSLLA